MNYSHVCYVTLFMIGMLTVAIHGKKLTTATTENCEVCVKFLGKFIDSLDSDTKSDYKSIEAAFRKTCKTAKKDDNRLCYYLGGTEDSATSILNELSKPMSWGMPADKICMKLYRKDEQICDLKYDVEIDLAKVELKKLKVKDLKNILTNWDEQCKGCTEKSDFISRIEELMPKHAPASAKARQEL